jgi:hypothetical protein
MLNGILNNILNKVVKPETNKDTENDDNDTNKDKVKNMTQNINEVFKLPISYNSHVKKLGDTIITDLELLAITKTEDIKKEDETKKEEDSPIYNYVFKPSNSLGKKVLDMLPTLYTTDTHFLKENQKLLESFSNKNVTNISDKHKINDYAIEETVTAWNEIKSETGFCEKYLFIDWDFAKFMNNNAQFLQLLSLYNITSPILSLSLPILVLIMPFFVIKMKGLNLNIKEYTEILRGLISEHAITKIFTSFHEVDFGQKMYLLISAALYLFSIYQNILICIRFYSNMKKIHDYLNKFRTYINFTIDSMKYHLEMSKQLVTYEKFNDSVRTKMSILEKMKSDIDIITPLTTSFNSIFKLREIGHIMHTFYQIYDNNEFHNAMLYSFGFNGYMNLMSGLKSNIDNFKLNKTTFIKKPNKSDKQKKTDKPGKTDKKNPIFEKMYYPKFIDNPNVVTNDCKLNKNIIITGPNASGKTTILKSALINILLSQQTGYGCFASLKLQPFDKFHCYLNIPDTSARDSLFQAEARRCKDIIDSISNDNDDNDDKDNKVTHFCIFDELYSGTNPDEAITSATAFMNYIVKTDNVTCLLTTHYVKICKKLSKNKKITNFNMKTNKKGNSFEYTYKLVKGISTVKGGLKVLSDMNYPNEILQSL